MKTKRNDMLQLMLLSMKCAGYNEHPYIMGYIHESGDDCLSIQELIEETGFKGVFTYKRKFKLKP